MSHPLEDHAVQTAAHPLPSPSPDRALLTAEEWQALLWPAAPQPHTAREDLTGATS